MKAVLPPALLAAFLLVGQGLASEESESTIRSRVEKTEAGERILVQEAFFDAPLEAVWDAYTTEEGWTAWAAPKARIDLRVGGEILTQYDTSLEIGDAGTNRLTIVNYVPRAVLTLKADLQPNWPEIMKRDADNLSNVILFEALDGGRSKITSYGIGYRDAAEYDALLKFFIQANEGLLKGLQRYLEGGERSF